MPRDEGLSTVVPYGPRARVVRHASGEGDAGRSFPNHWYIARHVRRNAEVSEDYQGGSWAVAPSINDNGNPGNRTLPTRARPSLLELVDRVFAALFPQQGNATQRVARTISQGTAAAAVAPGSL